MDLIDFFRFPAVSNSERRLFSLQDDDLRKCLVKTKNKNIKHEMMALFDSRVIYNNIQVEIIKELINTGNFSFSYMPYLDEVEGINQIDAAAEIGCKSIVFHPYLQKISRDRLSIVKMLSIYASKKGMFSCVCASYGSKDIFQYTPLEVVVTVAESIELPVVIVHGGGAKVLDALLIAESFPHVYLDTSFSLHYWLGSPIENAFEFAIRKLGANRCMFGSDAPFMNINETIEAHKLFCNRHEFSLTETHEFMYGTASKILGIRK